jgi:hypothetical protein
MRGAAEGGARRLGGACGMREGRAGSRISTDRDHPCMEINGRDPNRFAIGRFIYVVGLI